MISCDHSDAGAALSVKQFDIAALPRSHPAIISKKPKAI